MEQQQLKQRQLAAILAPVDASGRSDTGYRERVAMDSYYVRNWSVWLDLVLLARTVRCVLLVKELIEDIREAHL